MKILYLHGLDSHIYEDRKQFLESYGELFAPILDYRNTPNLFENLIKEYKNIDVIIDISAGGLVGYYLAQVLKKPCLLFNPALPFRDETELTSLLDKSYQSYMQVVIGLQDEVVPPEKTLALLQEDTSEKTNLEIHLINKMKHALTIDIFKSEWNYFFNQYKL